MSVNIGLGYQVSALPRNLKGLYFGLPDNQSQRTAP